MRERRKKKRKKKAHWAIRYEENTDKKSQGRISPKLKEAKKKPTGSTLIAANGKRWLLDQKYASSTRESFYQAQVNGRGNAKREVYHNKIKSPPESDCYANTYSTDLRSTARRQRVLREEKRTEVFFTIRIHQTTQIRQGKKRTQVRKMRDSKSRLQPSGKSPTRYNDAGARANQTEAEKKRLMHQYPISKNRRISLNLTGARRWIEPSSVTSHVPARGRRRSHKTAHTARGIGF